MATDKQKIIETESKRGTFEEMAISVSARSAVKGQPKLFGNASKIFWQSLLSGTLAL